MHHDLEINSLLFIHHTLGKLNFFAFGPPFLRRYQCGPRSKEFGDPGLYSEAK